MKRNYFYKKKEDWDTTMIELIVEIAKTAIWVLLAIPLFLGYAQNAHLATIQNDVEVAENFVTDKLLLNDNKLPSNWEKINTNELTELTQENKLYDVRDIVVDEDSIEEGDYFKLAQRPLNTKLKGNFYTNQDGKVYYEDLK